MKDAGSVSDNRNETFPAAAPVARAAWRSSMDVAAKLGVKRLVAPAIGCGYLGAPLAAAAHCALESMSNWSSTKHVRLEVLLVLHDYKAWTCWTDVAYSLFEK